MKNLLLVYSLFLLIGCSKGHHQFYKNYADFNNNASLRSKGWFPKIIFKDAYEIRSVSNLDPHYDFGVFRYSDTARFNLIFANQKTQEYTFDAFVRNLKQHQSARPDWFLDVDTISKATIDIIELDGFYLVKESAQKKIYFILDH